MAQLVKNLPAMQETWVWSLGWEDLLEKGTVAHSSLLAWRIPWAVYSPWGCKESDMTERLLLSLCQFLTTTTLDNALIDHGYLCHLLFYNHAESMEIQLSSSVAFHSVQFRLSVMSDSLRFHIKQLQLTHPHDKPLTTVRVGLPRPQDSFKNQVKSFILK